MKYVTNRLLNSCVISTIDVAAIFSFSLHIDSLTELQLADCHSELCPQDTNCVRPITAVKHPLHENSPNI